MGRLARQLRAKPGSNHTYYKSFDCSDIFAGLTIESDSHNIDTLRQMDGVINAWQMKTMSRPWARQSARFAPTAKLNYSSHQWTGVDKLHAQGIRGKGATVAIVDTGIDYKHKAVGQVSFDLYRVLLTVVARRMLWFWLQSCWRI